MKCLNCKTSFIKPKYKPNAKFCSKSCRLQGSPKLSGAKRGDAMRGRGLGLGYVKYNKQHQHRVLMAEKLGRPLTSDEIVHHKDGNKRNNEPSNLELTNRADHARHHSRKYDPVCQINRCEHKHYQKSYCLKHFYQIKRNGKIYEQTDYTKRATRIGKNNKE